MAASKKGMLSDLFDGTFRTLSRTWLTTLVCGGILFIPSAVLSWLSFDWLFSSLGDLSSIEDPTGLLLPLGLAYMWIALAALVQGFAMLFVRACVTERTARAARGESAPLFGLMGHVLTHHYGRLIGQRALQYTILGVTFGAASFACGLLIGLAQVGNLRLLGLLGAILLALGGTATVLWLSIRWSLTLESVVVEDTLIEQSLDRSAFLTSGAWWRVFGYIVLLDMMVGFAVSLIATPLVFFATLKSYAQLFGGLLSGAQGEEDLPTLMRSLFTGMGGRLGILQYVQSLCAAFVTPVFMTLLFLELRNRSEPSEPLTVISIPPIEPPGVPVP